MNPGVSDGIAKDQISAAQANGALRIGENFTYGMAASDCGRQMPTRRSELALASRHHRDDGRVVQLTDPLNMLGDPRIDKPDYRPIPRHSGLDLINEVVGGDHLSANAAGRFSSDHQAWKIPGTARNIRKFGGVHWHQEKQ